MGQASLRGPKRKRRNWIKNITSGRSEFYATIFRAAQHFYYGNLGGLRRPPKNSFLKPQMKIAAQNKNNGSNGRHSAPLRVFGLFNWIKIWNSSRNSDRIYGTTIHELAHGAHWDMNHGKYKGSKTIVKESWAEGFEWHLTSMICPEYSERYYHYRHLDYTGIVKDMVDDFKFTRSYYHSTYDSRSSKTYNHRVRGYTMRQLEEVLKGQKTWNAWKNNIKNKYHNATENNLDTAFAYWNSKYFPIL